MSFALLWLTAAAFASSPQLGCKAIYRTLDEKNETVERSLELPAKTAIGESRRHEADFEGKFFSVTEEKNGDVFAQITAPDYSKGFTARGAVDSLGRFTAAEVTGFTAYRVECQRSPN